MNKKSDKRGFTMAEMLVCLAIISVIATILIPTLGRIKPNKEKTMFKKAYQITERVIYELVNDPELYPATDINAGFDNIREVQYNGVSYGASIPVLGEEPTTEEQMEYESKLAAAKVKFCQLFALKLNTLSEVQACQDMPAQDYAVLDSLNSISQGVFSNAQPSFTTTDGVEWYLPATDFDSTTTTKGYYPIFIDVNGSNPPNNSDLYALTTTNNTCSQHLENTNLDVDRFAILVRADGKIEEPGVCAREYLEDMTLLHK